MPTFELARENAEKLWVKTPAPTTHYVWDFFMLHTFPELDLSMHRDEKDNYQNRYLNRLYTEKNDLAAIADGQLNGFWNHAYLPDDNRSQLKKDQWGVVIVPNNLTLYLDTLEKTLNTGNWEPVLKGFQSKEIITTHRAFECYNQVSKEIRTARQFKEKLAEEIDKSFGFKWSSSGTPYKTTLDGEDNTLQKYIALDFVKNVYETLENPSATPSSLNIQLYALYNHILTPRN